MPKEQCMHVAIEGTYRYEPIETGVTGKIGNLYVCGRIMVYAAQLIIRD